MAPFFSLFLLFPSFFLLSSSTDASTSFHYSHSKQESVDISYNGDAFRDEEGVLNLNHGKTGGYSVGRAYYSKSIRLWDASNNIVTNFSTNFTFWVSSPAGKETPISGGMAFFLAADANIPRSSSGGYLGLVSKSTSLNARESHRFVAIEFDSKAGSSWDAGNSQCHLGINVNSMKSVARADMNGTIFRSGLKGNAQVRYSALTRNLSVFLVYDQTIFELSHVVDLRKSLPEWVYVGFSGSTGPTSDLKKITSWNFKSSLDSNEDVTNYTALILWIAIPSSVFILVLIAGIRIYVLRKRKDQKPFEKRVSERVAPRRIPFKQLIAATKNFKRDRKVGSGASGEVFRGFLKDLKQDVAIKRLKESFQGEKEFSSEVNTIATLRHRNIVHLVGWCHEDRERLLVYEFMPNGSLDFHLSHPKLLSWERRYEIAKGVASAIFYLHDGCNSCIVHRDIKCSNIMLDKNFEPRLGDFGLARLTAHGCSLQSTMMAGTLAYMAPEMLKTGKASKETDVYSFGIVLLEMACGRKAFEPNETGKERLVSWLWDLHDRGDVMEAADKGLRKANELQMERLLLVGLWCAHAEAKDRPSITQVISALNFDIGIPDLFLTPSGRKFLQSPPSLNNLPSSSQTAEFGDDHDSIMDSSQRICSQVAFGPNAAR